MVETKHFGARMYAPESGDSVGINHDIVRRRCPRVDIHLRWVRLDRPTGVVSASVAAALYHATCRTRIAMA